MPHDLPAYTVAHPWRNSRSILKETLSKLCDANGYSLSRISQTMSLQEEYRWQQAQWVIRSADNRIVGLVQMEPAPGDRNRLVMNLYCRFFEVCALPTGQKAFLNLLWELRQQGNYSLEIVPTAYRKGVARGLLFSCDVALLDADILLSRWSEMLTATTRIEHLLTGAVEGHDYHAEYADYHTFEAGTLNRGTWYSQSR